MHSFMHAHIINALVLDKIKFIPPASPLPILCGDGVVSVVLMGGVEDGIMCIQQGGLISPVKIHSISVEEGREDSEQQVHVDGHQCWEDYHGCGADELIKIFISNHGKGSGVVELVVVAMDTPQEVVSVAHPVIQIFK